MKPPFILWLAALTLAGLVALTSATTTETTVLHVPGSAHAPGANNTVWRTDLEVRAVGTLDARFRIDLLRRDRDNTSHPSVTLFVAPGSAQRYPDVLDALFGFEGSATLRITTIEGEIRATSRTYNLTPDGTYGQFIGASSPADAFEFTRDATIIQLSSSPDRNLGFRTNIGLVNLVGFPINMEIDLYHADTRFLGTIETTLLPFEYDQIDDAFADVTSETVDDGFAIVRAITFGAEFLTYASVIDNLTGDPIYIPAMSNAPVTSQPTLTPTPPGSPTPTPSPTATPTSPPGGTVEVTTIDEEVFNLLTTSIYFVVGNGIQTSLILCSFDGTLSQVSSSNFSFIRGPTETVEWSNCCTSFGARLEYETRVGVGGPAVARSTCTVGTPVFAISGTDIDTGLTVQIDGEDLDIAIWP